MTHHRLLRFATFRSTRNAVAFMLAAFTACAHAHDTWFAIRAATLPGTLVMALGTGNLFPVQEFPVDAGHLREHGCRQSGQAVALKAFADTSASLLLSARPANAGSVTCWSELTSFEIELEPDKIDIYLDEIKASPLLRQRWASMQARGLRWRERYVKSARVEIAASVDAMAPTPAATPATPAPMTMDVLLLSGLQPIRAGEPLAIQVLRDGVPLSGFAIELRGEAPGQTRWFETDAHGRAFTRAPSAGSWIWRGTDLRVSATDPGVWESRFVTLAFEVLQDRGAEDAVQPQGHLGTARSTPDGSPGARTRPLRPGHRQQASRPATSGPPTARAEPWALGR